MKNEYGKCSCGSILLPVWFVEEERKTENGIISKTGRTRKACSHLECTTCLSRVIVDDSFDHPYR